MKHLKSVQFFVTIYVLTWVFPFLELDSAIWNGKVIQEIPNLCSGIYSVSRKELYWVVREIKKLQCSPIYIDIHPSNYSFVVQVILLVVYHFRAT